MVASIISQQHKHVAAKMFKDVEHGIQEAKNYLRLDHPNITKFVGVTISPQNSVVLLLELADCDLSRLINSSSTPLSINKVKKISLQIASALEYLHRNNLRHLDLKPQNVLAFQNGKDVTAKLADFGSILETKQTFADERFVAGTRTYLPPEHQVAKANQQVIPVSATFDVFAFGIILMEMLVWAQERRENKFKEVDLTTTNILTGEIQILESNNCCIEDNGWREDVLNDENGRKLIQIFKRCLMVDPTKRFSDGGVLL